MSLLSPEAIIEISKVLTFGAEKYEDDGPYNWRKGMSWIRVSGAVLRHIFDWLAGSNADPESGFHPLAHAAVGLMFLISYDKSKLGEDDRWKR